VIIGVHASDWQNVVNGLWTADDAGELSRHRIVRRDVARVKRVVQMIPLYTWLMSHSQLANRIKTSFVERTKVGVNMQQNVEADTEDELRAEFERLRPMNEKLLERIRRALVEGHGRLALYYIPNLEELDRARRTLEGGDLVRSWLTPWAAAHDVRMIDGVDVFEEEIERGAKVTDLYFLDNGHCTPRGYRSIALSAVSLVD
jgi:hypothetical protein